MTETHPHLAVESTPTRGLLAAALFALLAPEAAAESPAKTHPDDILQAGCAVHMAEADAEGIAEVTADCRWPVPPRRVAEVVLDQEAMDDVLSTVSESRVLSDGRVLQVHSMGWGVADRQVTLDSRQRELPEGGLRIEFDRAPVQEPLGEGRVQILVDEGYWEIVGDGAGGTHMRYGVRYDPGGNLKPWLVRKFQKSGVAQSMEEVREAAQR